MREISRCVWGKLYALAYLQRKNRNYSVFYLYGRMPLKRERRLFFYPRTRIIGLYEIIWKYCCTEIAFYLAWLVENEFLTLDPVINETIEKVKKRQTMPDDLFECIDLKLSEEDVSDKILPFIDYCLNDGFESIDNFYNKVSQKYANVFTDKYGERDSRRCGFTFKWDDYDEFKKLLDKEYKDYLSV